MIAEIGKNFIQTEAEKPVEEYLSNAIALVEAAAKSGADAVKFQIHNYEDEQLDLNIVSPHFKAKDRYSWVKRNTLSTPVDGFWRPLKEYCRQKGIIFFATPMSRGAAKTLTRIGVDLWKVGSGDILDFVTLDYLRRTGLPIIISSGMSSVEEVDASINYIKEINPQIALLHCVSKYPCPTEDLNLKTINFFKDRYNLPIGFSDHSLSIESCLGAVALGATVIEKHFSFNRELWGADHKVSLAPEEFGKLAQGIRDLRHSPDKKQDLLKSENVIKMLGEKNKTLRADEEQFRPIFRKSLMAGADLTAGAVLEPEMIYAMRPQGFANGLPSEEYPKILGKKLKSGLKKYQPLTWEVLG